MPFPFRRNRRRSLLCAATLACCAQFHPAGKAFAAQTGAAPAASAPIQLDVVVTDRFGKPVPGLDRGDFTLLDNNHPAKILAFTPHKGSAGPGSPCEVILLIDTMNAPFNTVSFTRGQIEKFLRRNGGRLPYPVSVDWITEKGIRAQQEPVLDGNPLADELAATETRLQTIVPSQGVYGALERVQLSLQILSILAQNEARRPDKKLVIWIGPGWPGMYGPGANITSKAHEELFHDIVVLSAELRQARISLYSVSEGQADRSTFFYQEYLKGIRNADDAILPNVSLKVLSVQSGGLVLPPGNSLVEAIETCIQDASSFYTLSFEPPPAAGPNDHHELKLRVSVSGLTARTSRGYYSQPAQRPLP